MVTEVFVMCDGANDSHGKLNVLGAFDMIVAHEFPFIHPHCTLAVRLRHDATENPEIRVMFIIQGASGEPNLASIDTTVKHFATDNPTSASNIIVNMNSLRFEKPGDYAVILQVDGLPVAITPLYVRSAQTGSVH